MGSYPELPLIETAAAPTRHRLLLILPVLVVALSAVGLVVAKDGEQTVQSPPASGGGVDNAEHETLASDSEQEAVPSPVDVVSPWDGWVVEPVSVPARGPLDAEGRYLYLGMDEGSMVLSVLPDVEIRSPQIDGRIDGYPVTTTKIPGSNAALYIVAVGNGTIRLQTVDINEDRAYDLLTMAVRSLGERLDGTLELPGEVTLVSERTGPGSQPHGEAWRAEAPTGEVLHIGRVRLGSASHGRELVIQTRMMGARILAGIDVEVWFLPQIDDPSVGTISWEEGGSRWSVTGATPDVDSITYYMAATGLIAEH